MFLLVILVTAMMATANDITRDKGFTKAEKQMWIDLHNYYRARVAKGEEAGQPKAADMIAMVSKIRFISFLKGKISYDSLML